MTRTRPLAGGGRAVEVPPERLAGFLGRFAGRHGGAELTSVDAQRVRVRAVDGALATIEVPFLPWRHTVATYDGIELVELLDHLRRPRTVGLILVRLGGHSVGVARNGRVVASSTGARPVHGRSAAGGQSQQRFARRREGQARVALRAAADVVARTLLPRADELDALVLGGDRSALRALAADRRLADLMDRAEPRVLDVPEPRRAVLDEAADRVRCVEVLLPEPGDEPR